MADDETTFLDRYKQDLLRADYRLTFETPHGRNVLRDILTKGGVAGQLSVDDAHSTAIAAGRHNLAAEIARMADFDPRTIAKLIHQEAEYE